MREGKKINVMQTKGHHQLSKYDKQTKNLSNDIGTFLNRNYSNANKDAGKLNMLNKQIVSAFVGEKKLLSSLLFHTKCVSLPNALLYSSFTLVHLDFQVS